MIEFFIFAGGWGLGAAIGIVVGIRLATKNICAGWRIAQHMNPLPDPPPSPTPPAPTEEAHRTVNPLPFLVNKDDV